jgi:hypothetical protein
MCQNNPKKLKTPVRNLHKKAVISKKNKKTSSKKNFSNHFSQSIL